MMSIERRKSDYENSYTLRGQNGNSDSTESDAHNRVIMEQNQSGDSKINNNTIEFKNEDTKTVVEFRDILEARDGCEKIALSNAELERFLRAGAFNIEKSTILFEKNEKYNRENADLLAITFEMCEYVYASEVWQVLRDRDELGRKVIVVNARFWNPDDTSLEYTMMSGWYLLNEMLYSEETQINGVCIILDLSGVTMTLAARFVTYFSIKQIQRLIGFYQGGYPVKVKSIHGVNTPFLVSSTYAGVKYLLKKKLRDRIHIHYQGPKVLDKFFAKDILPQSLNGSLPNEDATDKELMKNVYSRYDF